MNRRAYQRAALLRLREGARSFFLLWRRQGGKSTTLAAAALDEMMGTPGRLVTYASASLLLGREIVIKEAQVLQQAMREFRDVAREQALKLETVDGKTHRAVDGLSADDFADLFETGALQFRLWFDRTTYSRTQVIAPNPATARGWSGTVMLDEFGFIRDFRDLWEAIEPIISTDPGFRFLAATTPPKDDAHYSYELTNPPRDAEFPANAAGHWYTSDAGELVHRVGIHDAYAAGQLLYDRRTGRALTPEEHYARAEDRDAWRRNYNVEHVAGGTSAVGMMVLETAQRRGVGQCACHVIEDDLGFDAALGTLAARLGDGRVGLGIDLATTTKAASNPTAVAVVEQRGTEYLVRAVYVWKSSDPAVQRERFELIVREIADRPEGGRGRRLAVDATNERLFSADLRRDLGGLIPVELVVGSEVPAIAGTEPMNWKQRLGSLLVQELEDNHLALPPERYLTEDFRLVKKDRGSFVCEPDKNGRHGDTFDAVKLALHALSPSLGAWETTEGCSLGGRGAQPTTGGRRSWRS